MLPSVALVLLAAGSSAAAASAASGALTQPKFNWARAKYFYAFGDSYTFVQGTKGLANFSFIGDAFDLSFTPQELLEDEIIFKNTSSDGASWTEFLTGCFAGKPSDCVPRQLWNFAFAGAEIDKALLPLHHNFTVDLVDQVNQWAAYASDVVPHPPAETVVAWWIDINDTGNTLTNTTLDYQAFWEVEMQSLFGAVQTAYDHNLRGAYFFVNVPPMARSPEYAGTSLAPLYQRNIVDFNSALAAHAAAFAQTHTDVTVLIFDTHTWFGDLLDNAAAYGFKTLGKLLQFCTCKDPDYFWFNNFHPTERVHRLLAKAMEAELVHASQA